MNVAWKIMTLEFDAQYYCTTRAWHKKTNYQLPDHLETSREMFVCVCISLKEMWTCCWGTFLHSNYIWKTDPSACFHQATMPEVARLVLVRDSEKIEAFSIQVKICKIRSIATPKTVSLPRLSKDLQFYFPLKYDRKDLLVQMWMLSLYALVTKVILASGLVLTESFKTNFRAVSHRLGTSVNDWS